MFIASDVGKFEVRGLKSDENRKLNIDKPYVDETYEIFKIS
jgi:hypothetical protein